MGGAAMLGIAWIGSGRVEWTIAFTSLAIGLASLVPSYRKTHRNRSCLALFSFGMGMILSARLFFEDLRLLEGVTMVSGAVLIGTAHLLNRRLCRACSACRTGISSRLSI